MENKYIEKVIDINTQGQPVLKINGIIVFSDIGVIGDVIEVEIKESKRNYKIGKTTRIIEKSQDRIESKCKVYKNCGGCQFQNYKYESQLEYKKQLVKDNLKRIGKINNVKVEETIGMDNPYEYRNNIQIPVGNYKGKPLIGYYKKNSRQIVDTNFCPIQQKVGNKVIQVIRNFMEEENIKGYSHRTKKGIIRHLVLRSSYYHKDNLLIIVTNSKKLPKEKELIDKLIKEIPELTGIIHNVNNRNTNLVLGKKSQLIYGKPYIKENIGKHIFKISEKSFFQVNTIQTEKMYSKVKEILNLKGEEVILDLYSGMGTIGIYISNYCKEVIGIEVVKEAVEDGKENIKLNNIDNFKLLEGKVEDLFPKIIKKYEKIDGLIVDPPRKGLDKIVIENISKLKPEKIVYVSCNPSTLARDLKELKEEYEIKVIQPIDMFPQTTHVEVITKLIRR